MRMRRQEGVAASGAGQLMSMTGLELTGMEETGMHAPDMQGACLQVAATQTLPHQRHTWTSAAGESLIAQVWVEGSRDIAQRSSAGRQESGPACVVHDDGASWELRQKKGQVFLFEGISEWHVATHSNRVTYKYVTLRHT